MRSTRHGKMVTPCRRKHKPACPCYHKNMTSRFLTPEQLNDFRRDGFVVIRRMYGAPEMAALSASIDTLAARPPSRGNEMAYFEDSLKEPGKRILSRIEKFAETNPAMRDFIFGEKMTGRVADLLGEPAVL